MTWIVDLENWLGKIGKRDFQLAEVYAFEDQLRDKYPDNKHLKDTIRARLQTLRNRGSIEFVKPGEYRMLKAHIMHTPPRDYGEIAAVEILAMALDDQVDDGEYWELRTEQKRNEYRELAHEMILEAVKFWENRA